MTIEDELKSRLSEDFLENIIFLTELISEDTKIRALNQFLPKLEINKREQSIHKTYVLRKLLYEEALKANQSNPTFMPEAKLWAFKSAYLIYKKEVEKYNKDFKRSIPL